MTDKHIFIRSKYFSTLKIGIAIQKKGRKERFVLEPLSRENISKFDIKF